MVVTWTRTNDLRIMSLTKKEASERGFDTQYVEVIWRSPIVR
jgi:uncharacterized protein YihD (DUF1040 family)